MKRRSLRLFVVLLMIGVMSACEDDSDTSETEGDSDGARTTEQAGSTAQGVTADTIKIGAFGPLTGPLSFIGLGTRDGIQLAFDQINENDGVNGRQLELVYEQADSAPDSIAAARKLVEQDEVYAVIVASGSVGADAAASYLREAGIPSYNIVSLSVPIREPPSRTIFHGAIPAARGLSENLVNEVVEETDPRPTKVGVLAAATNASETYLDSLRPMFEAKDVELVVERFELGATNFASQLVRFSQDQVGAILYLGGFQEAALAIKQGPDHGLGDVAWVLDGQAVSAAIPALAGAPSEGVRSAYAFPIFPGQDEAPMVQFETAWEAKYGDPPPGRPGFSDLAGYGDAYVLAWVIHESGENLAWEDLIETWESITDALPSLMGDFGADISFPESFSEDDHQGNKQVSTLEIIDGQWIATSASRIVD